jgi:hypothetical protein
MFADSLGPPNVSTPPQEQVLILSFKIITVLGNVNIKLTGIAQRYGSKLLLGKCSVRISPGTSTILKF